MAKPYDVYSVDPTTGETLVTHPDGTVEVVANPDGTPTKPQTQAAPVEEVPEYRADPTIEGGYVPLADTAESEESASGQSSDAPETGSAYTPRSGGSSRRSYDSRSSGG